MEKKGKRRTRDTRGNKVAEEARQVEKDERSGGAGPLKRRSQTPTPV